MNAHIITLLNVSGITKRNARLALVRAGKVSANTLMSRLVYPFNNALRSFNIRTHCQKLMRSFCRHAFSRCQQSTSMMPL